MRRLWWAAFGLLTAYVAVRMGGTALWVEVPTPDGTIRLPSTYASVDHPFHVARAEMLWRELATGHLLRWIGQHQGGYPVEFYPLGEAWFEVAIRAMSFDSLPAESAHTIAVIALFLLPGIAFAALAHQDRLSPAVALLALTFHVSLPGSWYHGGYTELVQWGLVTNVAAAVASLLMFPVLIRFLTSGATWTGAVAAAFAALAIYCNPRSLVGLVALGLGAWLAASAMPDRNPTDHHTQRDSHSHHLIAFANRGRFADNPSNSAETHPSPTAVGEGQGVRAGAGNAVGLPMSSTTFTASRLRSARLLTRFFFVAALAALLAAPELISLARFGDLYVFVRYSGYETAGDYLAAAASAVSWPVLLLAVAGVGMVLGGWAGVRQRQTPVAETPISPAVRPVATRAVTLALLLYVLLTIAIISVPSVAALAPQLEPTRLMPLQRFLTLYLAAIAVWLAVSWVNAKLAPGYRWGSAAAAVAISLLILVTQTRPLAGPPPDPASPAVPPVGLYPVATSAQPEQIALRAAIRAAAAEAVPGTAILVLGSALSWHQPLWAPLWTDRSLYYDNWLWYWHADHAGTPGYVALAGHHYPDPEQTLGNEYLDTHGIGAVVVTGASQAVAAASPLLEPLWDGVYDAYRVRDPVTTLTFNDRNATVTDFGNQQVEASAEDPGASIVARINWHPRWQAAMNGELAEITRRRDGYIDVRANTPAREIALVYAVQPLDWAARGLAALGLAGVLGLAFWRRR
jgi:hypothetical protein